MVKTIGLLACLLIAGLPVAVQPDVHLLAAGATAALICVAGLLLPSVALSITGGIAALLVFSTALLMARGANASIEALLMGIALLAVLDTAHDRQRFRRAAVDRSVTRAHLANLALSATISFGVAALLAAVAAVLAIRLDASVRPVAAAGGGILVMVAILRAVAAPRPTVGRPRHSHPE